jgi:NTP pyrophosphatase (non-canonical NTP hydrolase)
MTTTPPTLFIGDYDRQTRETDRFGPHEIAPVLLGLFGEVGGVMAAAKKHRREGKAFVGYRRAVEEEFGDVLWYFTALCRRLGVGLDSVLVSATSQVGYARTVAASDVPAGAVSQLPNPEAKSIT